MKMSKLFTKTLREVPADETSKNAQLLIRAGYVYKEMAGVYAYLPLGIRVVEKIKAVVRKEMNAIDGQELIMTVLQPKETWETTTRWDDEVVDVWFKTKLKDDTEVGLAWSHEEPIVKMLSQYVKSYKDLPQSVYQFQTKMRNELRAKSGIMRGREFVMKDMYSVHATAEDLDAYYNKVIDAYMRIYEELGIGKDTYVTFASGGAFTEFSHEFQTVCEAGEDWLYIDRAKNVAVNEEVLEKAIKEGLVAKEGLEKVRSAEVGNIFNFGTDKAETMHIYYTDQNNQQQPLYLASYGVGVTRVMGVIAEKMSDEKGLVWPENIAPFKYYLVGIGEEGEKWASEMYKGCEDIVLYDDRDARVGEKLKDSELMGIPFRIVVSDKTLAEGAIEVTERASGNTYLYYFGEELKIDELVGKKTSKEKTLTLDKIVDTLF
jgi:prolyl-tRNA synthetase